MNLLWVKDIAASKETALVLSLVFNAVLCAAVWRMWKSREQLQDRVLELLTTLIKELAQMASTITGKDK